MRYILSIAFLLVSAALFSQTALIMEGKSYSNTDDTWSGVNIPRSAPTALTFKNNSITSVNRYGYLLSAGDEVQGANNRKLDGAVVTGNRLTWNGKPEIGIIPHGIFTGYNINVKVKYNYLDKVPMAIIRKSDGMRDVSGVVAYNIVKNPGIGVVVKGMNGIRIYNNTFYSSLTTEQTNRALVEIYENPSVTPAGSATGVKIFNNIFYTRNSIRNISVNGNCLDGFESDYNIYYCESGTPTFTYKGSKKTFAEWQALGYDQHSVVINPNFKDLTNFVPAARLDYGKDLGSEISEGLAINAKWGTTDPETAKQNGKWQAGAVIYKEVIIPPSPLYSSSVITEAAPSKVELTFSLALASTAPAASSFSVLVNGATRSVSSVSVSGSKVTLTLSAAIAYGDKVTVAYTKPGTNPLQSTAGGQVASFTARSVTNNRTAPPPPNKPPAITIFSPVKSTSFESPATITIEATASDPDGTVVKVEFYNGTLKLGERTAAPWTYTWKNVAEGTYSVTAAATDNSNARTISAAVTIEVEKAAPAINQLPEVSILSPLHNEAFEAGTSVTISSMASDPDGTVTKVEYFINGKKRGEFFDAPFSFSFASDTAGTFEVTAVAWDNQNATTTSDPVIFSLRPPEQPADLITLYPSPNHGTFIVELNTGNCEELSLKIVSTTGKQVYNTTVPEGETTRTINLDNAAPGMYILRVEGCSDILTTRRFIIL